MSITPRELEAVRLLISGHTDKQCADAMNISTRTVRAHLRSVQSKVQAPTRLAAIVHCVMAGHVTIDNATSANSGGK